jgi:hypothetical protein
MTKLLEYLKATAALMVSPCGKKPTGKHPSASQKIVNMVLLAWGFVFGFLCFFFSPPPPWVMLRDAIPCSVTLFLDQSDETIFCHLSWCSSWCEETFLCWSSCFTVTKQGTYWAQTFWYPKLSTIPWTAGCPVLICTAIPLSHVGSLWGTHWCFHCFSQYRQFAGDHYMLLSNLCVPYFTILYRLVDIAMAHVGVSIPMLKSCMNSHCGDFLHKRKLFCCTWLNRHVLTSHFFTFCYNHVTGASDIYSGVRQYMELVIIYCTVQYCLVFVHNSWCWWRSVWPSYMHFPLCLMA